MGIHTGRLTVGTTAVQVDGNYVAWSHFHIKNMDATKDLFIGGEGVTAETGFPVSKLESLEHDIPPGESLYMVSSTGMIDVAWLRIDR